MCHRYGNPYAMSWLDKGTTKRVGWDAPGAAAATPFYGIGVCCDGETYCPKECAGHAGDLILFAYAGMDTSIDVLAVLTVDATTDKDAARVAIALGVVVDPLMPWYGAIFSSLS
jgi:hypothetical protein